MVKFPTGDIPPQNHSLVQRLNYTKFMRFKTSKTTLQFHPDLELPLQIFALAATTLWSDQ
jgi:hypothetical protein